METTSTWINPSVLAWARSRLGFSEKDVEDLSKTLGQFYVPVTESEIRQWENGAAQPSLEQLETLSELYVCPVGYFFLEAPPQELLGLSFRGLAPEKEGRLKPLTLQTLRRFHQLAEWTIQTIEQLGIAWNVNIPSPASSRVDDLRVLLAREKERLGFTPDLRKEWSDANAAFVWWRRKIEAQGIFCFQLKLDAEDVRGASRWFNARYPFILVNHQDVETATGRLFTLLHEYYHLLTSEEGIVCDFRGLRPGEASEPPANRFAARMLLSHDELQQRLREIGEYNYKSDWKDDTLDEIRGPFFVSRDVVAIMLQEMGLAPNNFYNMKRAKWEKRTPWGRGGGGRPTNKELKLREIGYSLARMLSEKATEGVVPLDDLSYVLDMKVERVPEFLNWAKDELR
jgi:Zn-dependent peptidase ImmA (M78 family)